ncbi:MAG: thioesterase, partial [Alphaproteobacteria bacterium PA3]
WAPLYAKREVEAFSLGLRIAHAHCNARGLLHGGVISALADNAMGLACVTRMEGVSALTVSLSVDFLSVGRSGQWLEVRGVPAKLGRTLAFADARIEADGELIAKAAATFRIIAASSA